MSKGSYEDPKKKKKIFNKVVLVINITREKMRDLISNSRSNGLVI